MILLVFVHFLNTLLYCLWKWVNLKIFTRKLIVNILGGVRKKQWSCVEVKPSLSQINHQLLHQAISKSQHWILPLPFVEEWFSCAVTGALSMAITMTTFFVTHLSNVPITPYVTKLPCWFFFICYPDPLLRRLLSCSEPMKTIPTSPTSSLVWCGGRGWGFSQSRAIRCVFIQDPSLGFVYWNLCTDLIPGHLQLLLGNPSSKAPTHDGLQ